METPKNYKTLILINRKIFFLGLTPIQFGLFLLGITLTILVLIIKKAPIIIFILILGGVFFILIKLSNGLREASKEGNPDYLKGRSVLNSTPKKIIDKGVFNILINKKC